MDSRYMWEDFLLKVNLTRLSDRYVNGGKDGHVQGWMGNGWVNAYIQLNCLLRHCWHIAALQVSKASWDSPCAAVPLLILSLWWDLDSHLFTYITRWVLVDAVLSEILEPRENCSWSTFENCSSPSLAFIVDICLYTMGYIEAKTQF